MKHRVVLIAIWTILVVQAHAQTTLLVPSQHPDIQTAINAAQNGDTVLVAPGVHDFLIDFMGKAITVQSTGGPGVTTIGYGSVQTVTFATGETPSSVLQGFTINGNSSTALASGIFCQSASPSIVDCIVSFGSSGSGRGGGIRIEATTGAASPIITNCRIIGNVAGSSGGGIYGVADGATCSPVITDCVISGNSALGVGTLPSGGGGAMFRGIGLSVCAPVLERCTIEGNYALGGGIGFGGGGLLLSNTTATVRNCRIVGNSAASTLGYGGGVLALLDNGLLSNCLIVGNSATFGGGVANSSLYANLLNCTVVSNGAAVGSAVWAEAAVPAHTRLSNCIVWGNAGPPLFGALNGYPMIVGFSDVQGGMSLLGPSNISADPQFLDGVNGDFHLASSSPCRNAGSNGFPMLPTADLDTTSRIQDGTIDMGADEVSVLTYPGTADGLDLYALTNGAGDPLASTRAGFPGDLLTLRLASPSGTLVGGLPLFAVRLYTTGLPFMQPAGFPWIWLDGQAIVAYGALSAPPFGFPGLPPDGLEFNFTVPLGLSGKTVRMQGLVSSINALNFAYATSNATEVTF